MQEADQKGLETSSEAVYLDCVNDDGSSGFVVRLCRYPDAGFAWVWGHVLQDSRVHAFTDHSLACEPAPTDLTRDPAAYALSWHRGAIAFSRHGSREAPRSCDLVTRFPAHVSRHAPHGAGEVACRIEASFRPAAAAISNRAGRSEVLGDVLAEVTIGTERFEISGRGQFHEQLQREPRFTTPFSYLTLRGADLGLIAIRGARGARGHLLRADSMTEISRIELTPPGTARRLVLHGSTGEAFHGELLATYDYSVPVFDGYRPGTLVAGWIEGVPVSGCVNDYLLDQLRFDRWA